MSYGLISSATGASIKPSVSFVERWQKKLLVIIFVGLTACSEQEPIWEKPATTTLGCGNYQSLETNIGVLYNNVWNKEAAGSFEWMQCLEEKPGTASSVYGWSWHWPSTGRQIFAYPQIKRGTSPWEPSPRYDERFPLRINQLESLTIEHDLEVSSVGDFNVATTMWLTNTSNVGETPNKDIIVAEVMVWTYATPDHISPAGRIVGSILHQGVEYSIWLDKDWRDVSANNANAWIHIAFKAETPSLSAHFDVIQLLDAPELSSLNIQQHYIADVELGTEIMRGSGLLWVNSFDVKVAKNSEITEQ